LTAQLAVNPTITQILKRNSDERNFPRRAYVVAGEIRYVGKETDRKWEEGDEISVLEFFATEYGRKGKVVATEDVKTQIKNRKLMRGGLVRRNSYDEFVRWLSTYKSD